MPANPCVDLMSIPKQIASAGIAAARLLLLTGSKMAATGGG